MKAIDFFKEVRVELDKVVWPSREQTIRLTLMVVIITIVVGFFIGVLDYLLTELSKAILK
jgi:preprotein translocase subunit SecE